jgi:hypothetical protein
MRASLLLVALAVLPILAREAPAKLDGEQWKAAQARYDQLFPFPGSKEDKAEVARLLASDGEARSWKLLGDALVKESEHWVFAQQEVGRKVDQVAEVLSRPSAKRVPEDETNLQRWQEELKQLEAAARLEREILDDLLGVLADGPEALRKNLLQRARGATEWPVRAAGARIAARHPEEKEAQGYLQKVLEQDKDGRVRLVALEALSTAESGWEPLVIGRLADADWSVQLLAVRILKERKCPLAVPHMINALERAGPRLAEEIGAALSDLTGQQIEPYADAWGKWWVEHRDEFESGATVKAGGARPPPVDVHFYGLAVKSDRVLFIIDISSSMLKETKNPGPEPVKPPTGPVTPKEGEPPPPPPPEEILSGPKIDVAKDELKKAIKKLPKATRFNIIAFNHAVLQWQQEMKEATEANKEEALKWVRALQASGSTFIDGALRLGFRLAGVGAVDAGTGYAPAVDTIILMSDGAPTDNSFPKSNLMDPEVILQHVREWNPHKRIVIHTIAVDMVEGVEFMKKLAAENGGTYLDR